MSEDEKNDKIEFSQSDQARFIIELYKTESQLSLHWDKLRTTVLQASVLGSAAILAFYLNLQSKTDAYAVMFGSILLFISIFSFVIVRNCTTAHAVHFFWYEELRRHLSRRSLPTRRIENIRKAKNDAPRILLGEYLDDSLNLAAFLIPFVCSLTCFSFLLPFAKSFFNQL